MNELQVIVNQNVGKIEFNYEEIKAELQVRMDLYKNAVFTEDSKDIAKKEVAALRKMKLAIDQKRKEVKNQCLEPYKEFEEKARDLMSLIDEPIGLIDSQVRAFEEKRKAERREKVWELYESIIGELVEYLPFERIYDSKWDNVSRSIKSIREDLESIINSTKMAVDTISSMNSDKTADALEHYKKTLDMAGAIQMINTYEQHKAEVLRQEREHQAAEEERKRRMEEERIRQQERERIAEEERIRREEREKAAAELAEKHRNEAEVLGRARGKDFPDLTDVEDDLPFEQPATITVFYKIVATAEELEEVEMAFNSIGIYFERRDA